MLPEFSVEKKHPKTSDTLIIIPVYNEYPVIVSILDAVKKCRSCHNSDLLVIDDCSTDQGREYLSTCDEITLIRNNKNAGAGGVLLRGFDFAARNNYKYTVTMDSDGQHNACQIHEFIFKIQETNSDIVSGTRYPAGFTRLSEAFQDRQLINKEITAHLNDITDFTLTDSFCGFKAYKVDSLKNLDIQETGYGMLLELLVKANHNNYKLVEHPVPLIYLDETRDFNNQFNDSCLRRKYYFSVISNSLNNND
ncbi:MAG: glycosyltransferase family 2 protein [Planctomycetota bacterium]|jgi:dolichol-phosphate mannosyltransferase